MAATVQSGNTSVTGSVNVNLSGGLATPLASQTPVNFAAISAMSFNTTSNIYTVPAGKTLYVTQIIGSLPQLATGGYFQIRATDASDVKLHFGYTFTTICINLTTPLVFTTGQTVNLYASGTASNAIPALNFGGFLQ